MIVVRFIRKHFVTIVSILLALLFVYAAVSKMLDFEAFQVQLAQSPLLSAYAGIISYSIIIIEIIVAISLFIPYTNRYGLYAALGLMSAFTIYIYLILNYSDFIPCSCGGILEKLGWTEHLLFNLIFVFLLVVAIINISYKRNEGYRGYLKPFVFSLITVVCASSIVVFLFLKSEYIIKKENNFIRRFLPNPVIEDRNMNLGLNSYYFAGIDSTSIYLGNVTAPLLLTRTDMDLKRTVQTRIKLNNTKYNFRNLQVQIKQPYFYLYDGSVPIIYRGKLGDSLASSISYGDAYFTQIAIADSSTFLLRTQSSENKMYLLASLDLTKTPKLNLMPQILQKQRDGVFDVDGRLISVGGTDKFVYTYSYRNQLIVMDNHLQVKQRLNTIDTTTVAKIVTTRLSDGRHKMSAPPFKVNDNMTSFGDFILIQSNLRGKHESALAWQKASVIDMYRIDKQEYIGSFYINHIKGDKLSHMITTGDYLYILLGKDIIRYKYRDQIREILQKK
ncbi:tellurium resistance protein TerC [Elizabethkingia miricola]|uniref:MauE/DoxX family redox-associated membrane protein n=1 Tax=Bacteroidota TaxID=976 RepID=UPI000998FEF3|nr:tellurium resistance protein TerC [Elizabethkingia miricola]